MAEQVLRDSAVYFGSAAREARDGFASACLQADCHFQTAQLKLATAYAEASVLLERAADNVAAGVLPEAPAVEVTGTHWLVSPERMPQEVARHLSDAISAGRLVYEGSHQGRDWYRIIRGDGS